jgi:hypothetical protein
MKLLAFIRGASAAGAVLLLTTNETSACACCSDPGDYGTQTTNVDEFHRAEVQGITFAAAAKLYLTDADDETKKGLAAELSANFDVAATVDEKGWRLTFRTGDGKTGVLTLPMPPKLTTFAADIHDGATSAGGGPLLYKEWRFEGTAIGDGLFAKAPARYTLMFQGRGNRCDGAIDFSHWRLSVKGKHADFAFFGELTSHGR